MARSLVKDRIRQWWAAAPMTYGETHGQTEYARPDGTIERVDIGSKRFFELADERFYSWNTRLHTEAAPFSAIFPYAEMQGRDVLEIGCGMGCMAMNWAQRGARLTAVDLNEVSIAQTRQRFDHFGLSCDLRQADAESLPFDGERFDYVYSWGVLHHTPGTADAIEEIRRVLKPGARTGIMLYHRDSFLYRYTIAYIEGWLNLERRFLTELELGSRYGDGGREEGNPHTWPVTKREVMALFSNFQEVKIEVLGADLPPILNAWRPRLHQTLQESSVAALARRYGWSLWITAHK